MYKTKTYESIRKCLATRGYFTIRSFCKAHNIKYNSFLRDINLNVLRLSDVELIATKLNLTGYEIVEFFLPTVFENLKHTDK